MSQTAEIEVAGRTRLFEPRSLHARRWKNRIFLGICVATAFLSVVILVTLLGAILWTGLRFLSWDFITTPPHPDPKKAGYEPAIFGTVWICIVCGLVTLPLGVATAIFIEEFQPRHPLLRRIHSFVQLNISNLAGVPSVVYGIVGLTAFVHMFFLFGSAGDSGIAWGGRYYDQYITEGDRVVWVAADGPQAESTPLIQGLQAQTPKGRPVELNIIPARGPLPDDEQLLQRTLRADALGGRISEKSWYFFSLPLGRGVLAGGLTLMLVVLPILIISAQEALRAVPESLREASLGLGATRWQTIWKVILPSSVPGIMTGSIISMSRAIGEAAPLLMISGIVFITYTPRHLMDDFTAMPLQIYNWAQRPQQDFHELAASGILVLLCVLLVFNGLAVLIRHKFQKPLS